MKHEEKIEHMRTAARIVGYGFDHRSCDMLVSVYELILKKEGKTDLEMILKAKAMVEERDALKNRSEMLDNRPEEIK